MKKKNYSPYGTYSFTKVDAPKSTKEGEPSARRTAGKGDLRGGKK